MNNLFRHFPRGFDDKYKILEWNSALAILTTDFGEQFADICSVLNEFQLRRSDVVAGGGSKSEVAKFLDNRLEDLGWSEYKFEISIDIDGNKISAPTHKIDCVKGKVALDIEWNNKTEFYDRDLNNFRKLYDLGAISVGVIVTRATELQREVFKPLGVGKKYGASTTHLDKLIPKVEGGGNGGCPLLVIAVKPGAYVND
ncbi:BglII/BstYI family type II restriction endonuclease [Yunchengibacter salinarum]|uniref:BglII/BstYI family type II restriction endonuclease n=1 Tax=Yunchengibacter salinarum TaxID=3133399 RepID=UPI0035B5EA1E